MLLTYFNFGISGLRSGGGAGVGMQEDDQVGYSGGNGDAGKRAPKSGGGKGGFDKPMDDEIPF